MKTSGAVRSRLLIAGVVLVVVGACLPIAVYADGLFGKTDYFGGLGYPVILAGFFAIGLGIDAFLVRWISRMDESDKVPVRYIVILLAITLVGAYFVSLVSLYAEAFFSCTLGPC